MRKIYDCFPFFNELDLLEIRLNELHDVVDMFVLIEAERTHANTKKPLYYLENKERFSKFASKIQHVVIDTDLFTDSAADNERMTFNTIGYVIAEMHADANDLVMVGCADEIVHPNAIRHVKESYAHLVNIRHDNFCYYLNTRFTSSGTNTRWPGTTILTVEDVKSFSGRNVVTIRDATVPLAEGISDPQGWHFTFMGTAEEIHKKTTSYLHAPDLTTTTVEMLRGQRIALKDPLSRDMDSLAFDFMEMYPIQKLPQYVQNNLDRFEHLLLNNDG